MPYRETLPDDCPPDAAEEITEPRLVYRLVRHNPPLADDFRSQRAEKPDAKFSTDECQACGLSVFARRNDAARQAARPNLSGTMVCPVRLTQGAGYILKTSRRSHYTWWPLAAYDILAHCQMGAI